MSKFGDMMFWLTGSDEPTVQNAFLTHFKMLKNSNKIFGSSYEKCLSVQKKFRIEKTFCVTGIKKRENVTCGGIFEHRGFFFFTPAAHNVFSSRFFLYEHRMFICTSEIFV